MGSYYIDKSRKYADRRYSVEAIDKIGVLDAADDFMGGMYSNITAETLINSITDGFGFDVTIDAALKNAPVSGWLPIMKRRDALAQAALAIGAIIDATRSDSIAVKPIAAQSNPVNPVSVINKNRVYQASSLDIEFPFTGIELIEHNFTVGSPSSAKELFCDLFAGEKTVKFSEPISDLAIENGAIISSGANYAKISSAGNAACVLRGRPYTDNQNSITVKTQNLLEGTRERTEKIENCWLVNKNNSQTVAKRFYDYYQRQNIWDGDFLINLENSDTPEKIGGAAKIATVFETDGAFVSGQIERLTLSLGSKNIKARGIIRGE